MVKITKFNAWSVARLMGIMYAILGLVFGVIMFLMSLIARTEETGGLAAMFGIGLLIFIPVMYGVMGIVGGFVFAWLYNFIAGKVGGVSVDVEKVETAA